MSLDYIERPQLSYFNPRTPAVELSEQDIIDLEGLLHLELTPIFSWIHLEPEDRDYTLLGDYIGIAEDILHGWELLFGAMPRDKFTEVHSDLDDIYKGLAACQGFLDDEEDSGNRASKRVAPVIRPPRSATARHR